MTAATIYRHQGDRDVFSVAGCGVTGDLDHCHAWLSRWMPDASVELWNATDDPAAIIPADGQPPISLEDAVRILSTYRAEVRARSERQAELAEVES